MIITIDGPSSSGKGTIAKKLAEKLHYLYLDTGAMYRALTYYCLREGIDIFDEQAVMEVVETVQFAFDANFDVYINGENVMAKIRTDEISKLTSQPVSTYIGVRERIVTKEREIAQEQGNIIIDGRDSGTVVFPQADVKFFISASLLERAKRRSLQNKALQQTTDYATVIDELAKRDQDDIMRTISPLRIARDAHVVDTTKMDVQATVEYVYDYVLKMQQR